MQIKNRLQLGKSTNAFEADLIKALQDYCFLLAELLNGGLRFSDNHNCQIITVADTGSADVEFAVAHTLKRIPSGFILINSDKACAVYDSGTAWTATSLYFKCDTANAEIKIIVI